MENIDNKINSKIRPQHYLRDRILDVSLINSNYNKAPSIVYQLLENNVNDEIANICFDIENNLEESYEKPNN